MDPGNIPFNALIVGPTNSGKTQFLVNQLCGPFNGKFDSIVLICPTFAYNKTLCRFGERDSRLYVIICEQHQVEIWQKLASFAFEGTNTLILLDDCAASKDVKGRTGELVKLGFSARHSGFSVSVLTQQLSSIAKPFRENVAAIVLFYTPSANTTKAILEEYAGELSQDELKQMISSLKERKFAYLIFSLGTLSLLKRTSCEVYTEDPCHLKAKFKISKKFLSKKWAIILMKWFAILMKKAVIPMK